MKCFKCGFECIVKHGNFSVEIFNKVPFIVSEVECWHCSNCKKNNIFLDKEQSKNLDLKIKEIKN